MIKNLIGKLNHRTCPGLLILFFSFIAMFMANSDYFSTYYNKILYLPLYCNNFFSYVTVQSIVNKLLMPIFFLIVGIEVKYEILYGNLNEYKKALLPVISALGGIFFPMLIYKLINFNDPVSKVGWGIPTATDIVFSNSILVMLGNRVPNSLRIFLLSLAIIDDLGALIIITLFYNISINIPFSIVSTIITIFSIILINTYKKYKIGYYIILGIFLWIFMLFSGLHTTISGIILSVLIPFNTFKNIELSPAFILEKKLKPLVMYFILPMFAFVNSGISLHGMLFNYMISNLSLGIILGLLIGKPLGIMLFIVSSLKFRLTKLPTNINLNQIFAVSFLCSVGFTMSIFIANLAFSDNYQFILNSAKISILISSLITLIISPFLLKKVFPKKN